MHRYQLAYWLLLGAVIAPGLTMGQWRDPQFARLGPAEGLPAQVREMTQDSTGYIYFGTNTGLYRYDGHTFDYFGHDPLNEETIGPGDVLGLHAGRDGLVWMTLGFGGLNSFDPKTGRFERFPLPALPFRSIPGAHGLYEDPSDTLWVGATHFRLLAFDKKSQTYTVYSPDWIDVQEDGGRLTIMSIVPDRADQNKLWLSVLDYASPGSPAGSYGLVTFDKAEGTFEPVPCFGRTCLVDEADVMWGAYWANTVGQYNRKTGACTRIDFEFDYYGITYGGVAHDIKKYRGEPVVATSKALLKVNKVGSLEVYALADRGDQHFLSLFEDRDARLWVGTNQGAKVLDPGDQHIRFFSLEKFGTRVRLYPGRLTYSPRSEEILLTHTGDDLSRRIYRIPVKAQSDDSASYIPTTYHVHGIVSDKNDNIWFAGDGAFHTLSPDGDIRRTNLIEPTGEALPWVWNMKANKDGWVAAIGFEEFFWFHTDSLQVRKIRMKDLPGSEFAKSFDNHFDGFTLTDDHRAFLFSNEIFSLDLRTGVPTALRLDKAYNPDQLHIQYVGQREIDEIWISTVHMIGRFSISGDSLILQDPYTIADGLISPLAQELHFDAHGRIWTFTNSGMNCIDPATGEVRHFGTKEGLPNPFIDPRQVIDLPNGEIATVCANGVIVFDPKALWESVAPTNEPVVIKQIRIGGEELISGQAVGNLQHLELKPDQKLVDIEFQALAYPTDYRMEYSYRISGLHGDWIPIGQNRFVTLPSLSPGDYIFEVKAGNPLSNAPVRSLGIHVATPFYMELWFLLLAGLLLVASIVLVMQWRIRRIRKEESARTEINKKMAELELKALRSQMNPHFMFNSLNSIKNYILQAEPKLAAEYLSNFAHLIRMILQNSREKSITLEEELETLKLYIELEQLRFEDAFDFHCSVDHELRLDSVKIPPMLLQPYIENAIWHGLMHKKAHGHLSLAFKTQNGTVSCIIDDDGIGRAKAREMKSLSAVRYKSMGMGITKDRIEIMNKMDELGIEAEIIDKVDALGTASGTTVIIRIPEQNGSVS